MSPLDLIPTEYRLFAKLGGLFALVAGLMIGYYWLTGYHERIGYQHAVDVMTRQALEAEQAARQKEQSFNDQLRKAEQDAASREKRLRVELAVAESRYVRMRDDFATIRARLPGLSATDCTATADAALDVFQQCAEEYRALARTADGHADDARQLTEAWPR